MGIHAVAGPHDLGRAVPRGGPLHDDRHAVRVTNTLLGGMKAVIRTDVMQFCVLFGGQIAIFIVAILKIPDGIAGVSLFLYRVLPSVVQRTTPGRIGVNGSRKKRVAAGSGTSVAPRSRRCRKS